MVTWERITRSDGNGGTEHGLRRALTIDERFDEDEFTDTQVATEEREFWQSDFDNEVTTIDEQIAQLSDRKAKLLARKAKLTNKWQSLG